MDKLIITKFFTLHPTNYYGIGCNSGYGWSKDKSEEILLKREEVVSYIEEKYKNLNINKELKSFRYSKNLENFNPHFEIKRDNKFFKDAISYIRVDDTSSDIRYEMFFETICDIDKIYELNIGVENKDYSHYAGNDDDEIEHWILPKRLEDYELTPVTMDFKNPQLICIKECTTEFFKKANLHSYVPNFRVNINLIKPGEFYVDGTQIYTKK